MGASSSSSSCLLPCAQWAAAAAALPFVRSSRSGALSSSGTPLPRLLHRTLQRHEVCPGPGGRLVIVGDVHGCLHELKELLDKVAFDVDRDSLVLVGDLVHKGPSSAEVIRFARERRALAVRGNHDDQLLEAWHGVGRYEQSLDKYQYSHLLQELSSDELKWVQELPLSLSFPWLPLLVVHAGLVPGVPLERQLFRDLLWMRDVARDEESKALVGLQKSQNSSAAWTAVWRGPEHVVFGHDAKRKLQQAPFATGLDTGCCYGFHLTALVVDPEDMQKRSLVQVPAAREYSVPEHKKH